MACGRSGQSVAAADTAELFFVASDFGGEGFDAGAELVDLDGESGEGEGVAVSLAVFLDQGAQLGVPVESGPADAGSGGDFKAGR